MTTVFVLAALASAGSANKLLILFQLCPAETLAVVDGGVR